MVRERDDAERKFTAGLHGHKLADRQGRFSGVRGDHMSRMKQRRGLH